MSALMPNQILRDRLIESLYTQSLLLAEDAREYFDEASRAERGCLDPLQRVRLSCESLKITSRLMHIVAWLLTQRAIQAGELDDVSVQEHQRSLGLGPETHEETLSLMPVRARLLIVESIELHQRATRLDGRRDRQKANGDNARGLHQRLATAMAV